MPTNAEILEQARYDIVQLVATKLVKAWNDLDRSERVEAFVAVGAMVDDVINDLKLMKSDLIDM